MPARAQLPGLVGQRLGPAEWREMTQDRVNELAEVTEVNGGMQVKVTFTLEVRDRERPALVADCLVRYDG